MGGDGAGSMGRTATERVEGTAGGFLFVGEALALDLVNTEVVVRGKRTDLLDAPNALAAWWRAARARYPDAFGAGDPAVSPDDGALPAATALREALRQIFGAVADGRDGRVIAAPDLSVLNRVLATGYQAVVIDGGGALRPIVGSRDTGPDGTLLPVARSAFELLTTKDPARLHRCSNDRCVLLFYDTTKSATRRWCSVGCMNRARSAARYRSHLAEKAASALPPGAATGG